MEPNRCIFHQKLAHYFSAKPLYLDVSKKKPNVRKLVELPWQFAFGNVSNKFFKTLLDYKFIEAKVSGLGVQYLIKDYTLVSLPFLSLSKNEIRLLNIISDALNLSSDAIKRDFKQLPGQLSGRLCSFEENEIKELMHQMRNNVTYPWICSLTQTMLSPGSPLICSFTGHSSVVCTAMISEDGSYAVSASDDFLEHYNDDVRLLLSKSKENLTIRTWDVTAKSLKRTIHTELHSFEVIITNNCKYAVIPCENNIHIWNLESGEKIKAISNVAGISKVCSMDGRYLATVKDENEIQIWELDQGILISSLKIENETINEVILFDDKVLLHSESGEIIIENIFTGKIIKKLPAISAYLISLTPDRKSIIGIENGVLKLWDMERGLKIKTLIEEFGTIQTSTPSHESYQNLKPLTPDCKYAISIAKDDEVKIWDVENGTCLQKLEGITGKDLTSACISANGKYAITGSWDRTVRIWKLEFNNPSSGKINHLGTLQTSTYDKKLFFIKSGQSKINCYDYTLEKIYEFNYDGNIRSVLPDRIHALGINGNMVHLINLNNGSQVKRLERKIVNQDPFISSITSTPDGKCAVTGYGASIFDKMPKPITVWNLEKGLEQYSFSEAKPNTMITLSGYKGHLRNLTHMKVTPDNKFIVSSDMGGLIVIWRRSDGTPLIPLSLHMASVTALEITPNGRFIISGSADNNIILWDIKRIFSGLSENPFTYFTGHTNVIRSISVSPDGNFFISTSQDKSVRVWSLINGECLACLDFDEAIINSGINHDCSKIILGSMHNNVGVIGLENISIGPLIVTAWELVKDSFNSELAYACPNCMEWTIIDELDLGTKINCKHCNAILKINSFTINGDWKEKSLI